MADRYPKEEERAKRRDMSMCHSILFKEMYPTSSEKVNQIRHDVGLRKYFMFNHSSSCNFDGEEDDVFQIHINSSA